MRNDAPPPARLRATPLALLGVTYAALVYATRFVSGYGGDARRVLLPGLILLCGVGGAIALSDLRRDLVSRWLWLGAVETNPSDEEGLALGTGPQASDEARIEAVDRDTHHAGSPSPCGPLRGDDLDEE